ncbi:MAG: MBOAT family O-acyltransferase [Bacteroidales bacterium]
MSNKIGFKYPQKALNIILPIGLSFHTFQSLSYVIEVYRGHQKAEHHFGYYALYVMFYPQLVTGPIERPQNLLKQLHEEQYFKVDNLVLGLRLVLFGLFIKMVIADNVGAQVDLIYENPSSFSTSSILTGIFLYSFQIYCDFFGYSTIALGCAKCLGYDITDNFKTPYISKNLTEFWRRWHISLSTWLRDYVYIPLGGNRVKNKWIFNTMVVFLLSGIWHGANWTFAIWGLLHGFILVIEKLFRKRNKKIDNNLNNDNSTLIDNSPLIKVGNVFKTLLTFVVVSLLWVVFRAVNLNQIKEIFTSIFTNTNVTDTFKVPIRVWIFLGIFIIIDVVLKNTRFDKWLNNKNVIFRWFIYLFLIFSIVVFASVESYPFIYFQF